MARKRGLLSLLKRLFFSDGPKKSEKEKRRKWVFKRLKNKRYPSLAAPPPTTEGALSKAEEEQSNSVLNMAIATAVAAEAAVGAAQVAAEVVRLTGLPKSVQQSEEAERAFSPTDKQAEASGFSHQKENEMLEVAAIRIQTVNHQNEKELLEISATKIQTVFRSYLARKALRALKGIVKLQAIIRGQNVRRQTIITLKSLQSIINIQSRVTARRHSNENRVPSLRDKIIKMDSSSQRRWDDSLLLKEHAHALCVSKIGAAIRRERIKEYSFSHRKSAESERKTGTGRYKFYLEKWADNQLARSRELEDLGSISTFNRRLSEGFGENFPKPGHAQRKLQVEALDSPLSVRRRSFRQRKEYSLANDTSFSDSPVIPTYMAATESARAKARSMSTPRVRPRSYDTCSECYSPHKNKLALINSINTEVPSTGENSRPSYHQQWSPSLKRIPGPINSNKISKDVSFDSEYSASISLKQL